MDSSELDDHDRALFQLLQADARMPISEIARELGVSRATAARRLERLLDSGALKLLAETDINAANKKFLTMLGIKVEDQPVADVANALAALPQAIAVNSVSGRYDIEALIIAESHDELSQLLTREIPGIDGVGLRSPSLCLEVVKFESYRVPIL